MAKSYLNGVVLPEKSLYVPSHPELYMRNAVFSFVIVLENRYMDKDARQLMSACKRNLTEDEIAVSFI